MDEIFDNDFLKPALPVDVIKCRMFGIINTIMNVLEGMGLSLDQEFLLKLNPINRLIKCESVKQLRFEIIDILKETNQYRTSLNDTNTVRIVNEIVQYIQTEYSNINLSVTMIADQYSLSTPYISKFFRKLRGIGLLEFIHRVRIDKAMEIISTKDVTVNKLAALVGFDNIDNFIRVFKKYEGITPGKYISMVKKKH